MSERESYYNILEKSQKGNGDITNWLVWFLGSFARAIGRSVTILVGVFMRAEFWSKHEDVILSERQKKVINRVLEEGPSRFEGGLTTRKFASIGKISRATAFKELDQHVELGILSRDGKGLSVTYQLILR